MPRYQSSSWLPFDMKTSMQTMSCTFIYATPSRIFMEQVGSFQLLLNKEEMRGEFWYCVLRGRLHNVKAGFRFSSSHSDAKKWREVNKSEKFEVTWNYRVLLRSCRIVLFVIRYIWCSNIASFYWKPWLETNSVLTFSFEGQ